MLCMKKASAEINLVGENESVLGSKIQNVDVRAQPDIVGEIPARVVWAIVEDDIITVP